MRQARRGLSISHEPAKGITAVLLYKHLIRMYLFVPSRLSRNWPVQACRDFVCCLTLNMAIIVNTDSSGMGSIWNTFLWKTLLVGTNIQFLTQRILNHYCCLSRDEFQSLSSTWESALSLLVTTYRWVLCPALWSMCHFPFSFTNNRQGFWPCASSSFTWADVLALWG